jgi:hypothetical protein
MKIFRNLLIALSLLITTAVSPQPLEDNIGGSYIESIDNGNDSLLIMQTILPMVQDKFWLTNDTTGAVPTDVYYHQSTNKVFVYGKRNVIVVNANTMKVVKRIPISEFAQFYPSVEEPNNSNAFIEYNHFIKSNHLVFNSDNNLLYCVGENMNIYSINPSNYTVNKVFDVDPENCYSFYNNIFIKYDNRNKFLFFAFSKGNSASGKSKLYIIDVNQNYSQTDYIEFDKSHELRGLEINRNNNYLYLSINNAFYSYSYNNQGIINNTPLLIGNYTNDHTAGNMLYVKTSTMHKLFCFPNAENYNNTLNYYILNLNTNNITTKHSISFPAHHDIIIDPVTNIVYCGGGGHNCINSFEPAYYHELTLRPNITWLSIPRHARNNPDGTTNTPIVFDKNNFSNGYNTLEVDYNLIYPDFTSKIVNAKWEEPTGWQYTHNIMEIINSTRGYKLTVGPNGSNKLTISGQIEDQSTTIELKGQGNEKWPENWVGYWLYEEQSPFDAIPQNYLDHLFVIKTQDWYCYRDYPIPYSGNPGWMCALSIGVNAPRIHYADMVVLKSDVDINNFQWQNGSSPSPTEVRSATQHYQYTEKEDYTAYMIELDSTNKPQEVGAFVGNRCIGATTVLPDDTLILIRGYDKDTTGEVVFETYHDSLKSTTPVINDYYVKVPGEQAWQKRVITTAERDDHYLVSFKAKKNLKPVQNKNRLDLNVYPNPAKNSMNVFYRLKNSGTVTIVVYDIIGRVVINQSTVQTSGLHQYNMNTGYLSNGIYLLHLSSGNESETKQIIIDK